MDRKHTDVRKARSGYLLMSVRSLSRYESKDAPLKAQEPLQASAESVVRNVTVGRMKRNDWDEQSCII